MTFNSSLETGAGLLSRTQRGPLLCSLINSCCIYYSLLYTPRKAFYPSSLPLLPLVLPPACLSAFYFSNTFDDTLLVCPASTRVTPLHGQGVSMSKSHEGFFEQNSFKSMLTATDSNLLLPHAFWSFSIPVSGHSTQNDV